MVNIKEYQAIKQWLKDNPDGSYEEWFNQWKPVRAKKVVVIDNYTDEWNRFWQAYPKNADFEYKGQKFTSERVLRANEQVCRVKWLKILNEDKVDPSVVLKCMEIEVATRKEESVRKQQNQLQYMCGCEVWLNQKRYQGYIGKEMPKSYRQPTREVSI